jgi:hypothetical protein
LGVDINVWFAADGEFLFHATCPKCKTTLENKNFASHIAWLAHELDEASSRKIKPVRPPLLLKAPMITAEDRAFERAIGIEPDGEA